MKVKNLLVSVILLFLCSVIPVFAEGEENSTENTTQIENDVTVEKVESLKATPVNYKKMTVKWGAVANVHGYEIYRSTEEGVRGKVIATITSGDTTVYHDESVSVGTTYYYTIRAYREIGSECFYSDDSKQVAQTARIKAVANVTAKRKSYNKITLTWDKHSRAEGYYVYRSEAEKGTYTRIARVKGKNSLEYVDEGLVCGKTYYYKITGYITVNDARVRGNSSKIVSLNTRPATVQFTEKTVSKSESVALNWKKSAGAKGYVVYRSTNKDDGYSRVKVIKDADTLKWTDKNCDVNTVYYYKVRPYTSVDGSTVYAVSSNAYKKLLVPKEIEKITEYTYVKYVSGGSSTKGWDCSGFTQWVYKNIYGKEIPRSSKEQAKIGKSVSKSDMTKWKPGDILVYSAGGSVNHVGLYLGNGKMMHALNSKYGTVIQDVDYYESWDSRNNLKSVRRCL